MRIILAALLLMPSLALADGVYTRTKVNASTASSSGGTTSPGGTVTGANQYRSAGGTFAGDDLVIDNGAGVLSMLGVSVTGVASATTLRTGDGTLSAPAQSFLLDTDTGWYRAGNNQPNLTVNGAVVLRQAQTTLGIMTAVNSPSATLHVGTQCASGACAGSAYIAGSMAVNGGAQGVSSGIVGLEVSGSIKVTGSGILCTANNLGSIRYSSTTTSIGACLSPVSGTFNWYALTSTTTIISATQP